MRKISHFILLSGLAIYISPTLATADSFDDAVNHYLKGMDYCTEAKDALQDNQISKASQALNRYKAIEKQAANMDSSIMTSTARGMDSNLKYCQRVATDLEIAIGTPILDKAIAACDQAGESLKQGSLEQAQTDLDSFLQFKQEALDKAPSLTNQFSARNQISRCERLQKKINRASAKQESLSTAVAALVEDSTSYASDCRAYQQELKKPNLNTQSLQALSGEAKSANTRKQAFTKDSPALQALKSDASFEKEKQTYDANLRQGDQCLQTVQTEIGRLQAELNAKAQELQRTQRQVASSHQQCQQVMQQKTDGINQALYDENKERYEAAVRTRNNARNTLSRNRQYADSKDYRELNDQVGKLNQCLDDSRKHLTVLLGAIPVAAPVAAPKPVVPVAAPKAEPKAEPVAEVKKPTQAPATTISGSVTFNDTVPPFVLVYMDDGSSPERSVDITVEPFGFNSELYVLSSGAEIRFISRDFSSHRISASVEHLDLNEQLVNLQARQTRKAKDTWPDNVIATLRSSRGNVAPAYIANVSSKHYQMIPVELGQKQLNFELSNPDKAKTAYLLLPDYDPVKIEIGQGETQSLAVTRKHTPLGNVVVNGN